MTAPCGCPWDGVACPHCGQGKDADHIRRHHETATGYPVQVRDRNPERPRLSFKEGRTSR